MKRYLSAATAVLALGASIFVAAQQPAGPAPAGPAPAGPPPGARRGGGPPGGGPETGMNTRPPNAPEQKPAFAGQNRAPEQKLNVAFDVVTVTEGLVNPWGLAFLPDGKMLVTEKPGRLRVVSADGKQMSEPVAGLPTVDARGQGGLLDVALDPSVPEEPADLLELRRASREQDEQHRGRPRPVRRRRGAEGRERAGDLPPGAVARLDAALRQHGSSSAATARSSSRMGDRSITEGRMQAQKMDSLLGKIVRINADGSIPKDNPFVGKEGVRPEIWSFGHRNIQAATLHPTTGELWEVEHGTRGGDEAERRAQGQGLWLADHRLRHRVPGSADHRRHPGRRRAWSSRSTTGIRSSRRAA